MVLHQIQNGEAHALAAATRVAARSSGRSRNADVVRQMPLARIMDEHAAATVNFLKIDCEGSEFEVLPAWTPHTGPASSALSSSITISAVAEITAN